MTKPDPCEAFTPFADDAAVRTVGGLSFENGRDAIALHGAVDLTRDVVGLAHARALKATVDAIVATLEASNLTAEITESLAAPARVKNPFA